MLHTCPSFFQVMHQPYFSSDYKVKLSVQIILFLLNHAGKWRWWISPEDFPEPSFCSSRKPSPSMDGGCWFKNVRFLLCHSPITFQLQIKISSYTSWVDLMGNVHGRVEGISPTEKSLLIGSHLVSNNFSTIQPSPNNLLVRVSHEEQYNFLLCFLSGYCYWCWEVWWIPWNNLCIISIESVE